jgi:two-component system response regulator (stage 0 sporulation protein F)
MEVATKGPLVVIDDEVEFTKAFGDFFRARGYGVHTALTGPTGMQLVDQVRPPVVLMDLKMPGMDGDEVLKVLLRSHPKIKIIVVSAYNDGGKMRSRLMEMGAYAYFDKPVSSLRDLAKTVKEALEASQLN